MLFLDGSHLYIKRCCFFLSATTNFQGYQMLSGLMEMHECTWKKSLNLKIISLYCNCHNSPIYFFFRYKLFCTLSHFLIEKSLQLENGEFSTECKNLLYWLDMSSKVYKGPFLYYVRVFWGSSEPPTHLRKDIFTT